MQFLIAAHRSACEACAPRVHGTMFEGERFDGRGYPDGLHAREIPRLARIVAVCDAFDALVNDRPYRPRLPVDQAVALLVDGAGHQWDPEVVDLFVGEMPAIHRLGAA